jgi:hypothetical protein
MSTKQKTTRFLKRLWNNPRKGKRLPFIFIDKRQKFVIAILVLCLGLYLTEFQFSHSGFYIVIFLAALTDLFLFWAIHGDIKESKSYQTFILPFFYSLAFGYFYFLTPTILLSRALLIALYAFGLYSVFLSQNILVVSSQKTIALLSGARIVSFVVTLISFFFLTNIVYTFHVTILLVVLVMLVYTYLLVYHSLWTYNLQKTVQSPPLWVAAITACVVEVASLLWFWPSSPTVIALFLTGFFYTVVGLAHVWFERRLFKGILWEYVWVGCITFFVLILFTSWGK